MRTCNECGKDISHKRKDAMYCDKKCKRKVEHRRRKEKGLCIICGKDRGNSEILKCQKCSIKRLYPLLTKNCDNCGKTFQTRKEQQVNCSKECRRDKRLKKIQENSEGHKCRTCKSATVYGKANQCEDCKKVRKSKQTKEYKPKKLGVRSYKERAKDTHKRTLDDHKSIDVEIKAHKVLSKPKFQQCSKCGCTFRDKVISDFCINHRSEKKQKQSKQDKEIKELLEIAKSE